MHLGLAQVAPPACNTLVGERLVAVAKPLAGIGIRHVKHASLSHPDGHCLGLVGAVGLAEHALGVKFVVVVDGTAIGEHIGLRYSHYIDAFILEVLEHAAMVGPLVLVPLQAAHVLLFAIPVQVEHHAVEWITGALERVDHAFALGLVVVAIFRSDVSQRPQWWQFLATHKCREVLHHVLHLAMAVNDVVGDRLRRGAGIFQAFIANSQCRLAEVVEEDSVAFR